MDGTAHELAQGGVNHAMAHQRQLAGELGTDHGGLEVHPIIAADVHTGAGKAGFDELADGVCVHDLSESARVN